MNRDYEVVVGSYRDLIRTQARAYNDTHCVALIAMLFDEDPDCCFKAKAAIDILASGAFDELPQEPASHDGMPKTLALLWRRLVFTIVWPGVPSSYQYKVAQFIGKGTSRALTRKEEVTIGNALRDEFKVTVTENIQDACALILTQASAPSDRDYIVRNIARAFVHYVPVEVLKAAASAVVDTARGIPLEVLAASADRVEEDARAAYKFTMTMDELTAYLRTKVPVGPGGCGFVEPPKLFLDDDRVMHFNYAVHAEEVLQLRAAKEDVVNLCKDWLDSIRRQIQFFRNNEWRKGGKFPIVSLIVRMADYGGEGILAELKVE